MLGGVHLFSLTPHDKTLIFNACFLNYLEASLRTPESAASLQYDLSKYCVCHWTCQRLHLVWLSSKLSKLAAKANAKSCKHAMSIEHVRFSVVDASSIHSYGGDLSFFLRSSSSLKSEWGRWQGGLCNFASKISWNATVTRHYCQRFISTMSVKSCQLPGLSRLRQWRALYSQQALMVWEFAQNTGTNIEIDLGGTFQWVFSCSDKPKVDFLHDIHLIARLHFFRLTGTLQQEQLRDLVGTRQLGTTCDKNCREVGRWVMCYAASGQKAICKM